MVELGVVGAPRPMRKTVNSVKPGANAFSSESVYWSLTVMVWICYPVEGQAEVGMEMGK